VEEGRPIDVGAQRPAGRTLPRHRTPEGQHLPTGARPEGVAVDDNRRLQRSQGARNPSSLGASASKKGRLDRHARREAKPRVLQPSADPAWSLCSSLLRAFEDPMLQSRRRSVDRAISRLRCDGSELIRPHPHRLHSRWRIIMPLVVAYYSLGENKRLCDIVFAGSHDAGITDGDDNVKTQELNIYKQAKAGVRLFDLRITGSKTASYAPVTLNAYHAALPTDTKLKKQPILDLKGEKREVKVSSLNGGGFGLGLTNMLLDARRFVTKYDSEFLILKFDKCNNWELIAEACVLHLGDKIYTGFGSLNEKRLIDLKGKVIVTFKHKELSSIKKPGGRESYTSRYDGIFGCRSLGPNDPFDQLDCSLQYSGKGGTSAMNGKSDIFKITENIDKQTGIMNASPGRDPKIMGMVYWTTTGFTRSIRERNATMWTDPGKGMLSQMWTNCLEESIRGSAGGRWDYRDYTHASKIKTFMPNIVMIDFADLDKCSFIRDLNDTAGTKFTEAVRHAHAV
jgi:hypothetical protein